MKQNFSKENEKSVLGAILIDSEILSKIIDILSVEDFYSKKHKLIFKTMIDMYSAEIQIDTRTLSTQLIEIGLNEEVGGAYYITGLQDECPTTANAIFYAKKIREYATARAIKLAAQKIIRGDEGAEQDFIALSTESGPSKKYRENDAGNAELFAHLYGDEIRYNHTNGVWQIWNGYYWKADDKKAINELAKKSAQIRGKQSFAITDLKLKENAVRFAIKSEEHHKVIACLNSAKSIDLISTTSSEWNDDPLYLQCENGLLLLNEKVSFIDGKPQFMISQSNGIVYDESAECPTWESAILSMFNNDEGMLKFFQRCMGYSLSGDISEQKFFLLHGSGANGKSVIMEVLRDLMGDYAQNTRFETFEKKLNKQSNEIARLQHLRVVTANESGDTKRLDTELLKEVTGGDKVTARKLYHESFDYSPIFKLWLSSNTLPKVNDTSVGFWRRVLIIPLVIKFIGSDADTNLINKLKSELPGILNWALRGFERWTIRGLDPPKKVLNATNDYHNDSDVVAQFVEDSIIKEDGSIISAKHLYTKFREWYEENYSDKPMSQQKFGRRMTATGHNSEKIGGVKKYTDIKIR